MKRHKDGKKGDKQAAVANQMVSSGAKRTQLQTLRDYDSFAYHPVHVGDHACISVVVSIIASRYICGLLMLNLLLIASIVCVYICSCEWRPCRNQRATWYRADLMEGYDDD
eukprot:75028_1